MKLFENATLGKDTLKNRILRAPTYEGMCDGNGIPTSRLKDMYVELARNHVGAIITGFATISREGRSTMPGHCEIDSDEKIACYRGITQAVHDHDCRIYMQIVHQGRQTSKEAAGGTVYGVSGIKSSYFKVKPKILSTSKALEIIDDFATAALRAKKAGFDGVEIHAAHGNLIHEFILPLTNRRKDLFKIDKKTKIGTKFLERVIDHIRDLCGPDFTVIVKISASDDYRQKFSQRQFVNLIRFLDGKAIDAIEVGYGTLDYALNIFRGKSLPIDTILKHNRNYKNLSSFSKFLMKHLLLPLAGKTMIPFTPVYNLPFAALAKKYTTKPIISVGGFRQGEEMADAIERIDADFISLSRPLICEPDFVSKLLRKSTYKSKCISCNKCAIMTDSMEVTQCFAFRKA